MAALPCPDCKTPVSPTTRNCQNCGRYTRSGLFHIYARVLILSLLILQIFVFSPR
jgi:hypothetical protein